MTTRNSPHPAPSPAPRRWLPARVRAYARARRALAANAIEEYESGVCWDTTEFLRLNRAAADAKTGVPGWVQALADWVILRRLRYWDRIPNPAIEAMGQDRPLPVALTPKALTALAGTSTPGEDSCPPGNYRLYRDETACDSDDWGPPAGVYPTVFDAMRAAPGIPLGCWKTDPCCPDETFTETTPQWTILGPGAAAEATAMRTAPSWTGHGDAGAGVTR